jgi:predicted transcriptional regulator
MFWFSGKKRVKELEKKTEDGFSHVKNDVDNIIKWVKHLDKKDKRVFGLISEIKDDLSTIKDELDELRGKFERGVEVQKNKQVFKKLPVLSKQGGFLGVQNAVQTAVQTGNFYEILKGLSSNERLVVFTIMNSDMKLSYEDLALLLGKERSTIRGHINRIKQKSEGLIEEITEKNGKKRLFVPEEIKGKLQKYAKVRVGKGKKSKKKEKN